MTHFKRSLNMKNKVLILVSCLTMMVLPHNLFAQSDTLPEPNRMAEDFVTASVCIADGTDWRDDVLGTIGHAFVRLQCPYYELDYCFSYEGENVNDNLNRYMTGKTKMGMFAYPTDKYLEDYRQWNRTVKEYHLNLPPDAETRLWEIMDKHLTKGINLTQDMNKYGCAITIVRYVKQALDTIPIVYSQSDLGKLTRREIGYRSLASTPWLRLVNMVFTDSRYDRECPIDEKLIVPADLVEVWQNASVEGKILAQYKTDLVAGEPLKEHKTILTPIVVAILVLIISLVLAFTDFKYFDWLMLGVQVVVGLVLIYLWIVMLKFSVSAYIIMVLFNPLPAICWKWRRYWSLLYATVLLAGVVVLALLPHMLVDPALLILALAYAVMYAKEPIKRFIAARK